MNPANQAAVYSIKALVGGSQTRRWIKFLDLSCGSFKVGPSLEEV